MKKIISIIIVLAIVLTCCVAIFTGCKGNTDYSHTIIFYSSQGDKLENITASAIAKFEAKYPGWKVDHRTLGGYDDVLKKIKLDLNVNDQPDIAYCYGDHVALYLESKKVLNLYDYINSTETVEDADGNAVRVGYTQEEIDDFLPIYFEDGKATNFGGYEQYGYKSTDLFTLPFVKSTDLMFYNADALIDLGYYEVIDGEKVATPAKTWDELWAHCARIKEESKTNEKYANITPLGYDSEANWFITMCEQNGWGYTSVDAPNMLFNNENTRNWLGELKGYYDKGYIVTKKLFNNGYTSELFKTGTKGGLVYCIGSSGGASNQNPAGKFNYGVAPIPGSVLADGTVNSASISQGPSFVMFQSGNKVNNADEKQKMTFLFMKEMLDVEFQIRFSAQSGYIPSRASCYEQQTYIDYINEEDNIIAYAARIATSMLDDLYVSPAFKGSAQARIEIGDALYASIKGIKTPAKALSDAVKFSESID